jgi:hypothetical protein
MPVANLQSYRTVALRVHSSAFASQGNAMFLEQAVTDKLRKQCGFERVGPASATPADVVLDLNITSMGRGGGGLIVNPNTATIDTLLVLSDGQDKELLGTAKIHGKSSGMIVNGGSPDTEAIDVVAKTVADLLAKSGCSGPRVARAQTPPPPGPGPGSGSASVVTEGSAATPPPADETHRAEAEALNDQGKERLFNADLAGAIAAFQQANTVLPDARYEFNLCVAFGAKEQWDNAIAACRHARGMNPEARLATKIDSRIDLLQHHQ